jgi:hypothetical protein
LPKARRSGQEERSRFETKVDMLVCEILGAAKESFRWASVCYVLPLWPLCRWETVSAIDLGYSDTLPCEETTRHGLVTPGC